MVKLMHVTSQPCRVQKMTNDRYTKVINIFRKMTNSYTWNDAETYTENIEIQLHKKN